MSITFWWLVAAFALGLGLAMWIDRFINLDTRDKLRAAHAVRLQANELLASAEESYRLAAALSEPTAAYQTVRPSLPRRVLALVRDGLSRSPRQRDWAPGELAAFNRNAASARSVPTPAELARRLAAIEDPSRMDRVEVIAA